MFVIHFQKAITYIRETQEMALFATMADARLSAAFRASPLFYVMLPFIGFLLTLNALISGYQLAQASNRNFDRWFLFITSMVCAALASISLYGAAISLALGVTFVAGPWFFFSSLMGAFSHQLVMFGLNLYRASESPKGSIQSTHYLQAAFSNLFAMSLLAPALGAVVFVMLFPVVAPVIGSAFAITAVVLTGLDIIWRVIPHNRKQLIKEWFHLGKPDLTEDSIVNHKQNIKPTESITHEEVPQHHRLFTHCDYSAVIRTMNETEAKNYLSTLIQDKLNNFVHNSDLQDEKTKDKMSLLKKLLREMKNPREISKKEMLARYPLAFQSFWAEKGDVEQLFDAVVVFQDKYQQSKENTLSLVISC